MAPKRARTAAAARASASSSSQPAGATTKLTLHGGVPHHPALAGLWRDERLTDFAVSAEGVEFKAHRVALASSSEYFLHLISGVLGEVVGESGTVWTWRVTVPSGYSMSMCVSCRSSGIKMCALLALAVAAPTCTLHTLINVAV